MTNEVINGLRYIFSYYRSILLYNYTAFSYNIIFLELQDLVVYEKLKTTADIKIFTTLSAF